LFSFLVRLRRRQVWTFEERLLGRLQSELLQPEMIDYAVSEFGRQLRTALHTLSDDLAAMRRSKEQLEKEIQRFAAAIAHGGPLDSLVQEIATHDSQKQYQATSKTFPIPPFSAAA
jgi:hypothetical protein